ncbi:MAG: hypothetical protein AAF772_07510 [Acidobacteriota bacterium]
MRLISSLALLIVLFTLALPIRGDEARVDLLPAPADWRSELIDMPPPFAPTLDYEGQLHVKFSPTWRQFDAADGWTYAFVWRVVPQEVDAARLESDLETYFGGLMTAVGAERYPDKAVPTVAELQAVEPDDPWLQQWRGTVRTWNPFGDGEPVTLHFEIREMGCRLSEKPQQTLLFLVSKAPRTAPVWASSLRGLVAGAQC